MSERSAQGDESARNWLRHFLTLGDLLDFQRPADA
jgi:hypothetical protein